MSDNIKRNCNSCKFGEFDRCDTLKDNQEYQSLWNPHRINSILDALHFKDNFVCDGYKCLYIQYPIEVSKINQNTELFCLNKNDIGKFVKIVPCAKEYGGKTYLGLYLGDLPLEITVSHNQETKVLSLGYLTNPAIFVFELKKIVFGAESWWGLIENENELRDITQSDVDNVWYVKALKAISASSTD